MREPGRGEERRGKARRGEEREREKRKEITMTKPRNYVGNQPHAVYHESPEFNK